MFACTDTEATLNTLRHAVIMSGKDISSDRDMLLGDMNIPVAVKRHVISSAPRTPGSSAGTPSSSNKTPPAGALNRTPPSAAKTQHTTAAAAAAAAGVGSVSEVVLPSKWSHAQLESWLGVVAGGKFKDVLERLPSAVDGKALSRMPEMRFKQLCGGDASRGSALFKLFQEEVKQASALKLAVAMEIAEQSGRSRTCVDRKAAGRSGQAWGIRSDAY